MYCIFFLKFKSKVTGVFWKFKNMVENQSGCKIQVLRSNNGKEYTSVKFNLFCEEASIEYQLTAPYTPKQNRVSERRNTSVIEMARYMLHEKELPKTSGHKQQTLLFFYKIDFQPKFSKTKLHLRHGMVIKLH